MKRLLSFIGLLSLFLLLLTACGGQAGSATTSSSSKNAVEVQVKENEFSINSSMTSFTPGTTYRFVVTNNGKVAHEFMLMPKSEGAMSGMGMEDMDKMALASIENINPGETKTVEYTFPSSAANSSPEFACYLSGHYEAGMKEGVKINS